MCRLSLVKLWWAVKTLASLFLRLTRRRPLSFTLLFFVSSPAPHTQHRKKCFLVCQSRVPGIPRPSVSPSASSCLPVSLVHLKPVGWVSFTLARREHKVEGDVCRTSSGSPPPFPQCPGLFTTRHYSEAPWAPYTQPDTLNTQFIFSAAQLICQLAAQVSRAWNRLWSNC